MKGIIVARLKCGCVASAWLGYEKSDAVGFNEAIIEWLEEGYIISLEDRETISAEKCAEHDIQAIFGGR